MKKITLCPKKSAVIVTAFLISVFCSVFYVQEIFAQKNQSGQTQIKTLSNKSTWIANVQQTQKNTPPDTIKNTHTVKQSSETTIKEVQAKNNEDVQSKLYETPQTTELTELRDAQSRTYINSDGSYTKLQTSSYLHYKDKNGNWTEFDGKLLQKGNNSDLYEISKTDLPISIDTRSGKTIMSLEKDKNITFGENVKMIIADENFNEIENNAPAKSKGTIAKYKEIVSKNIWNNIDRQTEVDYWYVRTDYIINSRPFVDNTSGYIVFEDEVELPEGWQIIKAVEGEETVSGWQGDLIIINETGIEIGRFNIPVYYENTFSGITEKEICTAGQKTNNIQNGNDNTEDRGVIFGSYRLTEINGKYFVSIVVPLSWLLSDDRSYPITIDPTASNTYASGNISSCYYPTFNSINMNVSIPAGSTVTATNSQCTYVAVSPSWRSDGWIGFLSGSNLDGYWYCNVNSPGTCNVTGTTNSTIANGTYPSGTVPFTLKVARDYPSGSCNTTYLYVSNSTWTETVTYTPPCTVPGTPTLASPSNNANVQPGKTIHFTWNAPTTGTTPFTYTFYFYNGSSWQNWSAGSDTYFDLQLSEYGSNSWCGTNAQWYVKATNSCGNTNSATWNIIPYPKYSGSSADYTITPSTSCQTTGAHSIAQGVADYYSFSATAGNTYYFSTCGSDLGCGTSTGWDTYLKIYGTNGSCTTSAYNDDGGACSNNESFINGWTCTTTGTYYLQLTGYNSSAYGTYYLQYYNCTSPGSLTLSSPANNANVQPGKTTHFTWNTPATGTGPFTYTFYFYNGSSWNNWSCDTNRYIDLQLLEYNSASWCGTSAQWYVKATNSCGNTNSSTRNLIPYPKYSGSTTDYTIIPNSSCQTSGAHSIVQGGADYYSFNATAGYTYYFSTCNINLGCGIATGWDTYLKIYGTDNSCTTSAYNDDGGSCSNYESFINGWACTTTGTYYLQITGYDSYAYGVYYLQYKSSCPTVTANLTGGSSPVCYNTAPAMFTATGSGGDGTFTYLWYKNGSSTGVTIQTYTSPALTANATIYCAVSSCGQTVNTSNYNVSVYDELTANISGGTSPICSGTNPGTITATPAGGTSAYTYLWYKDGITTGIMTQIYNPGNLITSSEFYCAVTSGQCGTVNTTTTSITVNPLPVADAGNDTTISAGDSVQIGNSPVSGYTYLWSPSAGLSSTTIANPWASPDTTIIYTVTVSNNYGCSKTDSIEVHVVNTDFTFTPDTVQLWDSVTFTNTSFGLPENARYKWSFSPCLLSPDTNIIEICDTITLGKETSITGYFDFTDSASVTLTAVDTNGNPLQYSPETINIAILNPLVICPSPTCHDLINDPCINLVCNGNFEWYYQCPNMPGEICYAEPWVTTPTNNPSSPDYYNACFPNGPVNQLNVDVSVNFWGALAAHSGNAYAGYLAYVAGPSTVNSREYIQAPLKSNLIAGQKYKVEMFVNLADHALYKSNGVQVYISDTLPQASGFSQLITGVTSSPDFIDMAPYDADCIQTWNFWTKLTKVFTASASNLSWISIGNFKADTDTSFHYHPWNTGWYAVSMIMVDDVSIKLVPDLVALPNDSICKGETVTIQTNYPCFFTWSAVPTDPTLTGQEHNETIYVSPQVTTVYTLATGDPDIDTSLTVTVLTPPEPQLSGNNNTCDSLAWYNITNYDSAYNYMVIIGIDTILSPSNPFLINWNNYPNGGSINIYVSDSTYGCTIVDSLMVFECCEIDSADHVYYDSIIDYSITITNKVIVINDSLFIKNGAYVQWIQSTVYLGANATIIVSDSSTLSIEKISLLTSCDNIMWNGIFVENDSATLKVMASTVENAKNAAVMNHGGIFYSSDSKFRNNYKSIIVQSYNGSNYPSEFTIYKDSIYCNNTLLPQYPPVSATRTKYGIEINNVNNVIIWGVNFFQNMDVGIKCFNSNVFIYNNVFDNIEEPSWPPYSAPYAAIYSTSGHTTFPTGLTVGGTDEQKNYFYDCTTGIYSFNNHHFNIKNNLFDYTNNSLNRGTAIKLGELLHSTGTKEVTYDTITNYRIGILAQNVTSLVAKWNEITDIKPPYYSFARSYGIKLRGCFNSRIISNTIANDTTGDWRIEGISFDNSPSSYITCNDIYHMGKSMFAGGASNSSIVQRNNFIDGVDGFFLNTGIISPQGNLTHAQDNTWSDSTTFTDHQVVSYNSNGILSYFFAQQSPSYFWPTDNVAISSGPPSTVIPFFVSSGISLAKCAVPIPLPWSLKFSFEDSIAQGLIYFTDDTLGSIWLTQQGLYKYLVNNDTIINDTIIEQFKAESDTGNLGRFERVNVALSEGDYNNADVINDSINAVEIPAKALKKVNKIYINGWNAATNEFQLSEENRILLDSLAKLCPYIYGNAVYEARLLMSFYDTTEYYNDCELPPYENGQKINHSNSEETVLSDFSVYPNPAYDMITVTNPSGSPAIIEIYNYLGNKVSSFRIDNAINLLSVNELSAGLYIYRIKNEKEILNTGKIILIK